MSYIAREWGTSEDGYSLVNIHSRTLRIVTVNMRHADGSEFSVTMDSYGVPRDGDTMEPYTWEPNCTLGRPFYGTTGRWIAPTGTGVAS